MPPHNLENLSRTLTYEGKEAVILRPGIALVLYSTASLAIVTRATAEVLLAYLDFVPPDAIASTYHPGPDEYTPGRWVAFDSTARAQLLSELRSGQASPEEDGYGFVLAATTDGQAGNYGVRLGGIEFATENDFENETSFLRLELPWNLLDTMSVMALVDFVERVAALFPFCSGNAGMSFIHTVSWVPEAREAIHQLLPRFLGFDSAHDSAQLEMRKKSPPAHWLNLLDGDLVKAMGGEEKLRSDLEGCEVKRLGNGMLIRAAKFPPVVDVNRGGLDIGRLPVVARALKPIRFDEGLFAGLPDAESGQAWIERFDNLAPGDWENG